MQNHPDFYVLLGVDPSATPAEIQTAYRHRVQIVHPDRFDKSRMPDAWFQANSMLLELNEAYRTLSNPRLRRRYDQFHAILAESPPRPPTSSTQPPRPPAQARPGRTVMGRVWSMAFLLGIGLLGLWAFLSELARERETDDFFFASPPPRSTSIPAPARPRDVAAPVPEPVGCEPGIPPGTLPDNGAVWRSEDSIALAPLEIQVRGSDQHLVKLEQNGTMTAMMLVRANSNAEMLMPLGTYTLKYATGNGDFWCGETARFPFGRQTTFHRADDTFSFVKEADHYSGFVVELYLQSDGNLETARLPPQEW